MTLADFFEKNNKVALAFSGGVDSAYLLYEAKRNNANVTAYYVKTQFQPQFEYEDAIRLANELDASMKVIELDALADEKVVANPDDRCYYCKQRIFGAILESAKADGYKVILDGTNASDEVSDRPGMKALAELGVYSPLRECGLTKAMIRENSKTAGLFTWDKPAYACLATRVPAGKVLTEQRLTKTETAEGFLSSLGFVDFRVRLIDNGKKDIAKLQIKNVQLQLLIEKKEVIVEELKKYYDEVVLDLVGR